MSNKYFLCKSWVLEEVLRSMTAQSPTLTEREGLERFRIVNFEENKVCQNYPNDYDVSGLQEHSSCGGLRSPWEMEATYILCI